MQTFLPYESFLNSLLCLDKRRLGKQRVEAWQILNILLFNSPKKNGWRNHPATLMWKGYEDALIVYYNMSLKVFEHKGGHNIKLRPIFMNYNVIKKPFWLGNVSFHESHRSNLFRKDSVYYSQFDWNVPDDLPYIWPTKTLIRGVFHGYRASF